jgi:nuclear pore complex protein Nup155
MSYPTLPQTPQKALPGAYLQTPAPAPSQNVLFAKPAAASPAMPLPKLPPAASRSKNQTLSTEERGAQTVNDTLFQESRYPDLDNYLSRTSPIPSGSKSGRH